MITYQSYTDAQLLDLLRSGDDAAFTEIYTRYWDKLFSVAYHRTGQEQEAEEAVQDIFISLWNRRRKIHLSYALGTYLSVAVKYQVITRLAKVHRAQRALISIENIDEPGADTVTEWLTEKELKAQLEEGINALPDKCRIVFKMSREEGMKNALIATKLNISEKTVEGHITKAIHILRSSIQVSLPVLWYLLQK